MAKPCSPLRMSHVGGLTAGQCRSAVDEQRPRHIGPRGKRCEEESRDYNGGASYQLIVTSVPKPRNQPPPMCSLNATARAELAMCFAVIRRLW